MREAWGPWNLWLVSEVRAVGWRTLPLTCDLLPGLAPGQLVSEVLLPLHPEPQQGSMLYKVHTLQSQTQNRCLKSKCLFLAVLFGCIVLKYDHIGPMQLSI